MSTGEGYGELKLGGRRRIKREKENLTNFALTGIVEIVMLHQPFDHVVSCHKFGKYKHTVFLAIFGPVLVGYFKLAY